MLQMSGIWTIHYSGMPSTWKENTQISKVITISTAPTSLSAVIRLLKSLGVHPNYQLSWITSIGKPTVRDFISCPSRLDCEFARDRSYGNVRNAQQTLTGEVAIPRVDIQNVS